MIFETAGLASEFSIRRIENFTKSEKRKAKKQEEVPENSPPWKKNFVRQKSLSHGKNDSTADLSSEHSEEMSLKVKPVSIFLSSESLLPLVSYAAITAALLSPKKKDIFPSRRIVKSPLNRRLFGLKEAHEDQEQDHDIGSFSKTKKERHLINLLKLDSPQKSRVSERLKTPNHKSQHELPLIKVDEVHELMALIKQKQHIYLKKHQSA